ncbi:MAG: DHH family phosphoesterase, partial [Lachnospiraceae bacterium]|nr:DHH family phosphoesterase [Lachnospiraceae bacterium]
MAVNVLIYFIDYRAGVVLSIFIVLYISIILYMMFYNKPVIMNELVSFATQYGQIQRRLLRDLELPHALLDEAGKVIWTNIAFERLVHQEKGYRKSVTTLFPSITRDK